ncbi:MAG: hypothetical protein ACRDJN_27665 [Chloroflexota bacterium]
MQLDVMDVMARMVAVVVLVIAVLFIIMIWSAALGAPMFHIPWVEPHAA